MQELHVRLRTDCWKHYLKALPENNKLGGDQELALREII